VKQELFTDKEIAHLKAARDGAKFWASPDDGVHAITFTAEFPDGHLEQFEADWKLYHEFLTTSRAPYHDITDKGRKLLESLGI
jgi:hypothetical protein